MKRWQVWCLVGVVGTLAGSTGAQTVAFPPDYYSFEAIAQRMSVGGRTVQCARDLRQRLALVSLQPRSWQATRALLENALEVRFRPISDTENRWILERQPEVVKRERRLREQFARYLQEQQQRERRVLQKLLDKTQPLEQVIDEIVRSMPPYKAMTPQELELLKLLGQFIRAAPVDHALRNWRAYERLERAYVAFRHQSGEPPETRARAFLTAHPLPQFGFSPPELQWAQQQVQQPDSAIWDYLFSGLPRDPQAGQLELLRFLRVIAHSYLQERAREVILQQLRPPMTVLECIEQGAAERNQTLVLPADLVAWLLRDTDGKVVPVDRGEPVPVRLVVRGYRRSGGSGYSRSLAILEPALPANDEEQELAYEVDLDAATVSWDAETTSHVFKSIDPDYAQTYAAAKAHHDALLQQEILRRPLRDWSGIEVSLVEAMRQWAQAHQQELIAEVLRPFFDVSCSPGRGDSPQQWLHDLPVLLLEQRDGVWILRSWLAFLERVPDYPMSSIRTLLRSRQTYADWQRFVRETDARQMRWLLTHYSSRLAIYLQEGAPGLQPEAVQLAQGWLIVRILESLPPALRTALWEPKATERQPPIPVAALPPPAKTVLTQTLYLWRPALVELSPASRRREMLTLFYHDPIESWRDRLLFERTPRRWLLYFPGEIPEQSALISVALPLEAVGMPSGAERPVR